MPTVCYVPGCKSGYKSKMKENARAGIKNPSMFSAPKDDQLFEKWRQIIPRDGRDFSSKDKVCELHFEQDCIEREYVNLKPDGSLYQIPKRHVTLKKGSIPTIFQNLPGYLSVQIKKRKAPTPQACSSENKHRKFDDNLENVIDIPPQLNDNLENIVDTPPQLNDILENIIDTPPQLNDNVENAVINTPPQFNDFFKLSVEVKSILTPNSWWSVACAEDFVIFVKWNSKSYPERRVVICKDLSTKIFLMDVEVSLPIEECTIDNISELLKKVDNFEICQNADSRTSSGCLGFLDGKRKIFCSTCSKSIKNENDIQRREKHILATKKRKIVSEVKNIKRKNARLEKKILDLKSRLVESKYLWSQTKEEVLLEVIAHLPIEQQTAIKTSFSALKAKSNSVNESVEIQEENNSDVIEEELD